jgi:hypothetical protein
MTILTKSALSDKMLLDSIGKLIDLDAIIDRLQAIDCQQCAAFTNEQVKFAFLKWIENHLESIEMQPEWFINKDFKHFNKHLPELDGTYFPDQEYDQESVYEEIGAAHEAGLFDNEFDNESAIEDDFEGTPESAAKTATYW